MADEEQDDVRRRWYVVELLPEPHPLRGHDVLEVLLELLAGEVRFAAVDAYSDYASELTPRAAVAQATLRALGETRRERGDRWMGVELDLADPRHREPSVAARLTEREAAVLVPRVAHAGRVELLAEVQLRRRAERRARRRRVWRGLVRRLHLRR